MTVPSYLIGYARVSKGDEQSNAAQARAEGRIGGRRSKLTAAQQADVADNVIASRKSAAQMARLYNVSEPTISRVVTAARQAAS